jgi:hypothetical protein
VIVVELHFPDTSKSRLLLCRERVRLQTLCRSRSDMSNRVLDDGS